MQRVAIFLSTHSTPRWLRTCCCALSEKMGLSMLQERPHFCFFLFPTFVSLYLLRRRDISVEDVEGQQPPFPGPSIALAF
jgi:hypothetical protein